MRPTCIFTLADTLDAQPTIEQILDRVDKVEKEWRLIERYEVQRTKREKMLMEEDLKEVILGRWTDLSPYVQGWAECWNEGIVEDPWAWRSELWPDEEGEQ